MGWLAVHGFFILSGYLMTFILHKNYGYHTIGIRNFLINRALRLYPIYWCALIISIIIIMLTGSEASNNFFPKLAYPNSAGEWGTNISLIYPQWFPARVNIAVIPPSWTLTIEWLFYILMALGLSRNGTRSILWLLAAIVYFAFTYYAGKDLVWRYSTLAAGALPFAIGACLFHLEALIDKGKAFIAGGTMTFWLCTLLLLNGAICVLAHAEALFILTETSFYLNMILNAALIVNLSIKGRPEGTSWLHRIDRVTGDLSYPIYLLHLTVAFGVSYFIFGRTERIFDSSALVLMGLTVIISSILGLILNRYPDRYFRKLRVKFK